MKDFIAHCHIENGKIVWKNEDYLNIWLPKYEGLNGVLTIKKKWSKRSLNQNALYWKWLGIISEYNGNTPEELHVIMKGLYAPKKIIKVGKKHFNIPMGTSELSKGQMVEYMFHVEREANEMGLNLPHPEDLYEDSKNIA